MSRAQVTFWRKLLFVAGSMMVAGCLGAAAAITNGVDRLEVLQAGTQTYKNVTVTTKAKDYIFVTHSGGMTTVKLADIDEETRLKLGYLPEVKPKSTSEVAEEWAKKAIVQNPEVQKLETEFRQSFGGEAAIENLRELVTPTLLLSIGAMFLLLHILFSYCLYLICQKAGSPPGALVWIPLLQLFPMLRAAGMSGWWFLAWFVPIVQLVAQVMWCIKIAEARGKSIWTGIALVLPVTNFFAFLYLAFSSGVTRQAKPSRKIELMTLETA